MRPWHLWLLLPILALVWPPLGAQTVPEHTLSASSTIAHAPASTTAAQVLRVHRTTGDRWFLLRRATPDQPARLYYREHLSGRDRLLVDPQALPHPGDDALAISDFSVSPNGRYVAYALAPAGAASGVLHLLDTGTGRNLGAPIEAVSSGGLDWSPDSKTLIFNRRQPAAESADPSDSAPTQVWRFALGTPEAQAVPIFGAGVPGADVAAAEQPQVRLTHDGHWALGLIRRPGQTDLSLYLAPQAGVLSGQPQWRRLFDRSAQVSAAAYFGDVLYLLSRAQAPRGRLLALTLTGPGQHVPQWRQARVLLAPGDHDLRGLSAAADALYVAQHDGKRPQLYKLAYGRIARLREVKLPASSRFALGDAFDSADPQLPGLVLGLTDPKQPVRLQQIVQIGADGSVRDTELQGSGRP